MKKRIIAILLSLLVAALAVLSGCSGGISGEEAKAHVNGFLEAVGNGDYENAAEYLHPERPADLEIYFEGISTEEVIDFTKGIEIIRYTGVSSAYYDSSVGGSTYELEIDARVGERQIEMEIELVRNEGGFGIYNLDIDT